MNKLTITAIIVLANVLPFFAQTNYVSGYYITNTNEKVSCQLLNKDWLYNPTEVKVRMSDTEEPATKTIADIQEFGTDDLLFRYVRAVVKVDRSGDKLNAYSTQKGPQFKEETVFLEVLVTGNATLYAYKDNDVTRFFFKQEGTTTIEPLVYKHYLSNDKEIAINEQYKQQLNIAFVCLHLDNTKVKYLQYNKKKLVNLFTEYNNCSGSESVTFTEEKKTRDFINLTPRIGVNMTNLSLSNSLDNLVYENDIESTLNLRIGLEAEYVLPINNNKWSILVEPTYQPYKRQYATTKSGTNVYYDINYQSIEVPLGIRHYMYLNNKSSLFVDCSYYFYEYRMKSELTMASGNSSTIRNDLHIVSSRSLSYGLGYKYDKWSTELKYNSKNVLSTYTYWEGRYNTITLLVGYTIL